VPNLIARFSLLLLLLVFASTGFAANGVQGRWSILQDQDFTLHQVQSADNEWQQSKWDSPNLGFTSKTYWFRLQIDADELKAGRWYLWIHNALLTDVQFSVLENGVLQSEQRAGTRYGVYRRTVKNRLPSFEFLVQENAAYEIYLKVTSTSALQIPAQVVEESEYITKKELNDTTLGVFLGILVAMALYNFVLYLTVKDKTFLMYVAHVCCFVFFVLSWQGIGPDYLWVGWVEFQQRSISIATFLAIAFSMLFCGEFLKIKAANFSGYKIFNLVRNLGLLGALMTPFMNEQWAIIIASTLTFPAVILVLQAMWSCASFRYRPTRLFVLGWMLYVFGAFSMGLNKFGFVQVLPATENMVLWGAVLDMILLCIALGDKYHEERNLKIEAQEQVIGAVQKEADLKQLAMIKEKQARQAMAKAVDAQEAYALVLERRVAERTRELKDTLQELELISERDALTKLKNRRFFNSALEKEIEKGQRLNTAFAILMIDIDHFKSVNDSCGHIAGDECIQAVAQLLQRNLRRSEDLVCRYGGEEFVALLSNCDENRAMKMAEELRARVAECPISCAGQRIMVTVSIGVLAATPARKLVQDQLINEADMALYEAKTMGRNCICLASG